MTPKVAFFFFPEKVSGSINQSNPKMLCFFFSAKRKKKNTRVYFFFSQKKFMSHSFRIWWVFLYFFMKVWCVFFFQIFVCFLCVFFFLVKVHIPFIQSILKLYFFFVAGKKKYSFFNHSIDFPPKCGKNEL